MSADTTASARPALRSATPATVWALCVLQLLVALGWSVTVPIFRAPDEIQHVDLARHVATGEGYPDPSTRSLSRQIVVAGRAAQFSQQAAARPDRNVRFRVEDATPRRARLSFAAMAEPGAPSQVPNQMTQHPPLYYAVAGGVLALLPETTSYDVQVWLLRALGALAVAPLPWLAWATVRWLVDDQRAALAAAAVPLTIPMLAHIAGSVGNDGPLAVLGGVFTVGVARLVAGDARVRTGVLLGLAAGLGLLIKAFALAWLAALPVAAVVAVRRGRLRASRAAACAGYAGALAVVVGGWWYGRNVVRFGELQPTLGPFPEVADGPGVGEWLVLVLSRLPLRFWGQFGWVEVALPWTVVWLVTAGLVVATVAAVAARRPPALRFRWPAVALLVPLMATLAGVVAGAARLYLLTDAPVGLHGRYLYGGVVGLAAVVGVGAAALAGWRARWLPAGMLGLAVALNLMGQWLALRHWWGPAEPDTVVVGLQALLAWSPLPWRAVVGLAVGLAVCTLALAAGLVRQARTARPMPAGGSRRLRARPR